MRQRFSASSTPVKEVKIVQQFQRDPLEPGLDATRCVIPEFLMENTPKVPNYMHNIEESNGRVRFKWITTRCLLDLRFRIAFFYYFPTHIFNGEENHHLCCVFFPNSAKTPLCTTPLHLLSLPAQPSSFILRWE